MRASKTLTCETVAGEVSVDSNPMITNGNSVHGWPSGSAVDCEDAISVAKTQDIKCLIEKFPLEKAQEAYEHMLEGKARFRAVLVME